MMRSSQAARRSIFGTTRLGFPPSERKSHLSIVGQLDRGSVKALDYARSIADRIIAVRVDIGSTDREILHRRWEELESDIHLEIIDSPFRSVRPLTCLFLACQT
jgi:hypothetical protein